eukprot:CAMPEP_0198333386 /NCGR_PEP_ID=MMETSP1450-20131203/18924_1 /TAXON_ID=753684 ORGANISM="Madagascaria erythrocladiodes, Strain CCMP3234" /NCGR_SAMPLE_ID=MMETSP1450 /ASSEMBLY_ACC=CAM_ASM_001115 /LENGTH=37 /DNA_ID= /DNA_START= /DNA_END= /DNA_ORIENTATION=
MSLTTASNVPRVASAVSAPPHASITTSAQNSLHTLLI